MSAREANYQRTRIQPHGRLNSINREEMENQRRSPIEKTKLTDGRIVHAVHEDLLHTGFLERFLLLKVPRHLLIGSGGGERAGQADDHNVLSRAVLRHIHLRRGKRRVKDFDARNFRDCHGRWLGDGWKISDGLWI